MISRKTYNIFRLGHFLILSFWVIVLDYYLISGTRSGKWAPNRLIVQKQVPPEYVRIKNVYIASIPFKTLDLTSGADDQL